MPKGIVNAVKKAYEKLFEYRPKSDELYSFIADSFYKSRRSLGQIAEKYSVGLEDVLSNLPDFGEMTVTNGEIPIGVIAHYFGNLMRGVDELSKKLYEKKDNVPEHLASFINEAKEYQERAMNTATSTAASLGFYYKAISQLNIALMCILWPRDNLPPSYQPLRCSQSASK